MEIKQILIQDINPANYNPRSITKEELEKLKKGIQEFGLVDPLIINADNTLIGGHQRLKAIKGLQWKEAPCVVLDLPKQKEKALNIALNKISGDWEEEALQTILKELQEEVDFDVALTGFDFNEIDEQLNSELQEGEKEKPFSWRAGMGHASTEEITKTKSDLMMSERDRSVYDHIDTIFCQYSGGRDSTAALWWAAKNFPDKRIIAVFAKVEVEFPAMQMFVKDVCDHLKVELEIVQSHRSWWPWIQQKGWPSIMFRPCQPIFIHGPVNDFYKKFNKKGILLVDGSRAKQAGRGSKKSKISKIPTLEEYEAYHPVYDLMESAVWDILSTEKIPIWKGYNQGFVRTACWCCPGQCSLQAAVLQRHYPGLTDEIRYWEKRIQMPLRRGGKGQNKTFDEIKSYAEKKIEAGAQWTDLYKDREQEVQKEGLS